MKTICIGGGSSNSGKTSVAVMLAKAFPGWAAVKVTPCRPEAVCPHGNDCGACAPPDGNYEIVSDHEVLAAPDKDTARFLEAGVTRVLWVRSLPEFITEAVNAALSELSDAPGVIFESTTAIRALDGLKILTVREGVDDLKESARSCLSRVDLVALNVNAGQSPGDLEKLQTLVGRSVRIIPMCAALPPDDPANRDFVESCRAAVGS